MTIRRGEKTNRRGSAVRQIGVCRFANTLHFSCRGGIHASRVRSTFSPKRPKCWNLSLPGGINASPTVFFRRFLNRPTNTNLSDWAIPEVGKAPNGVPLGACKQNYFANSTALVSRITLTLIWPGYSSSDSIFLAMSRARRIMLSSVTTSGLTMIRTSRPAWMA